MQEMQETKEMWIWSPGQEDALEKEMAIHSSILAWKIPWTEGPGWLQYPWGHRVRHDLATKQQHSLYGFKSCQVVSFLICKLRGLG